MTDLARDGTQILAAGRSQPGRLLRVFVTRLNEDGTFDEFFGA